MRLRNRAASCLAICVLTACGGGEIVAGDAGAVAEPGDHPDALPNNWDDAYHLGPPERLDGTLDDTDGAMVAPAGDAAEQPLADAVAPPPPTPDAAPPAPEGPPSDCPRVRVTDTGGIGLNVRPDPSTGQAPVGNLPDGSIVDGLGRVDGEVIEGDPTWYEIQRGDLRGFVTSHWVECVGPAPPPGQHDDEFLLPFGCGVAFSVTQGNNSPFSHNGRSAYAFDFSMPLGTSMLAMRGGTVAYAFAGTQPGDPCYEGGGPECINAANYVIVRHGDGTLTTYAHLRQVDVSPGQDVAQGQQIGLSGSTGWSTGPHAHVEREGDCGHAFCDTIPLSFADVPGGVPNEGDVVTSQNGCN